ncbi:MAG: hypothetical protein WC444_05415 [Candidatus Paceibacterota bacterium]
MKTAKKIPVSECVVGKEYVTEYGRVVQMVSGGQQKSKFLVLLTKKTVEMENDYTVYDKEELMKANAECSSSEDESVAVPPPEVLCKDTNEFVDVKGSGISARQLVKEKLLEGPQTRDSLAKAIVDNGLSKNTDTKKVKCYVSVILANLKKKDGLNIVSDKPGSYHIEQ